MTDIITLPPGHIDFFSCRNKTTRSETDTEATVFTARVNVDMETKGGQAVVASLREINPKFGGVKHALKPGDVTLQAYSKFPVTVTDKDGVAYEQEEIPQITSGTGALIVQVNTKNPHGASLILLGVKLLDFVPYEAPEGGSRSEQILAAIKAAG